MKKLLVLTLTVVMLLSIVSMAWAGTMTWTGNMREWFYSVSSDQSAKSLNTFLFDRVELQFVDAFNKQEGVSALFQWRTYAKAGGVDTRLDSGFYYKKGLFSEYDEIDVGALDKLPFRLGLSKNSGFVDTGLGSKMKVGNCTGVRYEIDAPNYTVGVGLVNASMDKNYDLVNGTEGFAYSVRLDAGKNFFGMVEGLRLGFGYNMVPTKTVGSETKTNNVVDVAYVTKDFWGSWEHGGSVVHLAAGDQAYQSGDYFEAGMNIGAHKVWAGRLISGNVGLADAKYKDSVGGIIDNVYDGTIIGGIYTFPNGIDLQAQYVMCDGKQGNEFDLRFRYSFK